MMIYLSLLFPILYAEMRPIEQILQQAEAKQDVAIEEKTTHEEQSTKCTCVSYARTRRPDLPNINASDMVPATTTPYVGGLTLFYYPHSGESHVAYNEVVDIERKLVLVAECNYIPGKIGKRWIRLDDPMNRVTGHM
jgi:hypothetical protein